MKKFLMVAFLLIGCGENDDANCTSTVAERVDASLDKYDNPFVKHANRNRLVECVTDGVLDAFIEAGCVCDSPEHVSQCENLLVERHGVVALKQDFDSLANSCVSESLVGPQKQLPRMTWSLH